MDKRASASERDCERLSTEVSDLKDEARYSAEQLGEARGQLASADERLTSERANFERLLEEKDQRATSISTALDEALIC